jgi:hypothetical protein
MADVGVTARWRALTPGVEIASWRRELAGLAFTERDEDSSPSAHVTVAEEPVVPQHASGGRKAASASAQTIAPAQPRTPL